jgi:hypothetical protein
LPQLLLHGFDREIAPELELFPEVVQAISSQTVSTKHSLYFVRKHLSSAA